MKPKIFAMAAIGLMTASACSTPQSMPPRALALPKTMPDTACLTPCPPLPKYTATTEQAAIANTYQIIQTAGACARLHDACRASKTEQ